MKTGFSIFIFLGFSMAFADLIDGLQPGQWIEVPNTRLSAVNPCPADNCPWSAIEGQSAVMNDWSGGAFDTRRDRLIVWGGGHGGYAGNEVYVFSLDSLKWIRVTDPAPDVGGTESTGEYPLWNGLIQPRSLHSCDFIEYMPAIDRFVCFGKSSMYPTAGHDLGVVHAFDFNTLRWERRPPTPAYGISASAVVDPVTGHAFVQGTDSHCWIAEYCPESTSVGKWKTRGGAAGDFTYKYLLTMACDPVNRCLVSVGDGEVYFYDIHNPDSGVTRALAATTGDNAVVGVANPGVEYDPVTGRVIAWGSGRAVYSLDVQSRVWTRIDAGGADPGSPNMNGTFGRFRYSPAHNVFVLVNTTTTNVFVYRHTAGTGLAEAGVARRALVALDARPNPFQKRTRFMLKGGVAGPVELRIFDLRGRLTDRVRADGPELAQGVEWDASGFPAGLYAVQCRAGKNVFQTTVLLAR